MESLIFLINYKLNAEQWKNFEKSKDIDIQKSQRSDSFYYVTPFKARFQENVET